MNAPTTPNPGQQHNPDDPHPLSEHDYPKSYGSSTFDYGRDPLSYSESEPARTEEGPGKVLGIVSLVATLSTFIGFNFLGPLIGVITGLVARRRSRAAGFSDNELGKWGFILGLIFLGVALLSGIIGITFGVVTGIASLLGA